MPNEESYTTNGFIDLEIEINGKKFIRSCENFFILKGMKDELLKEFFNSIASRYESLIDKELMIGYGVRTPHRWFIKEIKLTDKGIKLTRKLFGEQLSLPIK